MEKQRSVWMLCLVLSGCAEAEPPPQDGDPVDLLPPASAEDQETARLAITRQPDIEIIQDRRGAPLARQTQSLFGQGAPAAADPTPRVVFGSDDRVRVTPTTSFPARAQVRLVLSFADGYTSNGSGTLIGRKYIITAGHCVYSHDHLGWATKITAFPGQDGNLKPYTAYATKLRSVTGWTDDEDNDYDYALITLDRNIGDQTGWFGLASLSDDTLDSTTASIAGYPAGLIWGAQYKSTGPIEDYDSTMLFYDIDTSGGMSGSGVYGTFNGQKYVFGVHRGDTVYWLTHYNCGPRITNARFNLINGWMASGT